MPVFNQKPPFPILQRGHPLAQGLKGAWLFNDAGTPTNSSTETRAIKDWTGLSQSASGSYFGGTPPAYRFEAGPFGLCASYLGTPGSGSFAFDLLDAGKLPFKCASAEYSIALWVRTDGVVANWASTNDVFSQHYDGHGIGEYARFDSNGSTIYFEFGSYSSPTSWSILESPAFSPSNQWHHYVCVRSRKQGGAYLYKNGVLIGSIPNSTIQSGGNDVDSATPGYSLGYAGSALGRDLSAGAMDSALAYNRGLSATEVQALYQDQYAMFREPPFASFFKSSAIGTLYNKTLTAVCTSTSTLVRSVGKVLSATGTSTSVLSRTAALHRTLTAACTSTSVLSRNASLFRTLSATCTSTSTLARSVGKTLLAACTSAATFIKNYIPASGTVYAKTLVAVCTSTSSLVYHSAFVRTLAATCTSTSTMIRGISKTLLATCTSTSVLSRTAALFRTLTATCTSTLNGVARKCIVTLKTLTAVCTTTSVVSAIKSLAAAATSLASKLRPYKPQPSPVIPGNDTLYLLNELQKVSNAFNAHVAATKDLDARLKAAGW